MPKARNIAGTWCLAICALLFSACPSHADTRPDEPPRLRLFVPAYIYLGPKGMAEWEEIFTASSRVPLVAVVNTPSSGPGNEPDATFAKLFQRAGKSSAVLIGYVDTSYARRPIQDVKNDVDKWVRFYPGIRGILLDQQAAGKEQVAYYKELYQYIRGTCGLKLVVANPGTICDETYFSKQTSDVICLHEGDKPVESNFFPDWTIGHPLTDVLVLQYGVKTKEEMLAWIDLAVRKKFGYIYITDRDGGNPWDHLPTYWKQEVDAVQKVNAPATK
jgi:hypothetical protein